MCDFKLRYQLCGKKLFEIKHIFAIAFQQPLHDNMHNQIMNKGILKPYVRSLCCMFIISMIQNAFLHPFIIYLEHDTLAIVRRQNIPTVCQCSIRNQQQPGSSLHRTTKTFRRFGGSVLFCLGLSFLNRFELSSGLLKMVKA